MKSTTKKEFSKLPKVAKKTPEITLAAWAVKLTDLRLGVSFWVFFLVQGK
jgi:hypothetical protein